MATDLTAPNGESLRLVARRNTTQHQDDLEKNVLTDSSTIEVIVSDGRILSAGSQWGHVAIEVDGQVYGMAHTGYDKRKKEKYLSDNEKFRDSIGVVLRASPAEKKKIQDELERRVCIGSKYNLLANSCSTNVADVLEGIGILAHDPRFFFAPASTAGVTPKELLIVTQRSKRAVRTIKYHKQ